MNQLTFPCVQEDVLASMIRQQKFQCDELIRKLESNLADVNDISNQIKKMEQSIRHVCRTA